MKTLLEFPRTVWNSVFRNPIPDSDLGRSQTSFTNFFLHIHPVKVNRHTLKPLYTLGLGLMSFFLFVILVFTGILLINQMTTKTPPTNKSCPISTPTLKSNSAKGILSLGNPTSASAPAKPKPCNKPNVKATSQGYLTVSPFFP